MTHFLPAAASVPAPDAVCLGLVMLEMVNHRRLEVVISGIPAFPSNRSKLDQLIQAAVQASPVLGSLIDSCLQQDPEARCAAQDMVEYLKRYPPAGL